MFEFLLRKVSTVFLLIWYVILEISFHPIRDMLITLLIYNRHECYECTYARFDCYLRILPLLDLLAWADILRQQM